MKNAAQRKAPTPPARTAYRTLEGWALGVLMDQHAVAECGHHGHRKDRSDQEAWNHAREEAWRNPIPGATPDGRRDGLDRR